MDRFVPNKIPAAALAPAREDRIARLERALVLAAYIVISHGEIYAPYVDRLEKELEDARKADPSARAQAILERYIKPVPQPALPAPRP